MADLDSTLRDGATTLLAILTESSSAGHCIQDLKGKLNAEYSQSIVRPRPPEDGSEPPKPKPPKPKRGRKKQEPEEPALDGNQVDGKVVPYLDQRVDKDGTPTGIPRKTINNLYIILRRDRRLRGRIWLNQFDGILMLDDRPYRDTDDTRIVLLVSRAYDLQFSEQSLSTMTRLIGEENGRNPLTDELSAIVWDGTNRTYNWLVEATGCDDIEVNRQMGEKWLIQAVARAFEPGCKADCILILTGPQGAGKSTMFSTLASREYFSDTPIDIGSSNSYTQISRAWIYEVAELDSIRRSKNSAIKAFFSAQEDNFRPAYGRHAITQKRHVVFAGTTNNKQFINDDTGSRRYWPVKTKKINLKWVKKNRDQLWAEAVAMYNAGETWFLDDTMEAERREESMVYSQEDPWLEPIRSWLQVNYSEITAQAVLEDALKVERSRLTRRDEMRVSKILQELGLSKVRTRANGERRYVWVKPHILDTSNKKKEA
jgi:predicted P-loop ATPase